MASTLASASRFLAASDDLSCRSLAVVGRPREDGAAAGKLSRCWTREDGGEAARGGEGDPPAGRFGGISGGIDAGGATRRLSAPSCRASSRESCQASSCAHTHTHKVAAAALGRRRWGGAAARGR